MTLTNRREHERFRLRPMYTEVVVRSVGGESLALSGHAYDISEGGICFELDRAIEVGREVAIEVTLPRPLRLRAEPSRGDDVILTLARIVWADDDGVRGPVRLAAKFTAFAHAGDRERLLARFASGEYARAA